MEEAGIQPLTDTEIETLIKATNWDYKLSNDTSAYKDPYDRPAPDKGKIHYNTAASAISLAGKAMGRDLKALENLADESQVEKLDRLAAEIVEKNNLGEKSAQYLEKELGAYGFSQLNVKADAQEIVAQRKQAEREKSVTEREKTAAGPEVTQSKPRRRATV